MSIFLKPGINIVAGIAFPVFCDRMSDYEVCYGKLAAQAKKGSLATGGFSSVILSQEMIDFVKTSSDDPKLKELMMGVEAGPVINATAEWVEQLSHEEMLAVLTHEEFHLSAGHLETDAETVCGILNDIDYEIAADAAAAERHGKIAMRNALMKMVSHTATIIAEDTGEAVAVILKRFMRGGISQRLKALKGE